MVQTAQENLSKNLRKYRLAKKYTQDKLSEICGISCDYLSEIERGKRVPGMKRLDMLAEALGVDTYKLIKP